MHRQQSSHKFEIESEPIYSRIWEHLKRFPKGLAVGSQNPPQVSGSAAAIVSAGFGCFLMMATHHFAHTSEEGEKLVSAIGHWIPGSNANSNLYGDIGSYGGKETMLLIGWLVSWPILHVLWKKKNIKARTIFFWLFTFLIAATVMCWHPLFPYLPLM